MDLRHRVRKAERPDDLSVHHRTQGSETWRHKDTVTAAISTRVGDKLPDELPVHDRTRRRREDTVTAADSSCAGDKLLDVTSTNFNGLKLKKRAAGPKKAAGKRFATRVARPYRRIVGQPGPAGSTSPPHRSTHSKSRSRGGGPVPPRLPVRLDLRLLQCVSAPRSTCARSVAPPPPSPHAAQWFCAAAPHHRRHPRCLLV